MGKGQNHGWTESCRAKSGEWLSREWECPEPLSWHGAISITVSAIVQRFGMPASLQDVIGLSNKPIVAPGHGFVGTSVGRRHALGCLLEMSLF